MIPLPRLIPKAARLSLAVPLFLPLIVHGSDLVRISSGNWHQADGWLDGDVSTNWIQGRGAWIPTGRSVSVNASTTVSDLHLDGVVTPGANPLTITGNLSGEGTFAMPNLGTSGAGVNGLVFATGAPIEMRQNVTLADQTNGRIVISAMDAGTEVTFNGFWDGWGSNTTHNLFVTGGARFLFGPEARVNNQMRDIIRARAFFARGDGHPDNVLEFHADFNADMGTAEQPVGGLSTLRVGDMTLITNATQNLPTIHKRLSNGGPTHHGLLIFDQGEGAHWIVRSQNQEYDGGIFWSRNWTLTAETDLLSIPVNRPGEDVGFGSTTPGTTLTKRGPGTLILDDAQGYVFNSTFLVEEGAVVFLTDPFQTWPGGRMVNAGNHLSLLLTGGGQVAFEAPTGQTFHVHHIAAMDAATVRVGPGRLAVSETLSTPAGTTLQVVLGVADEVLPKVTAGELAIGGVLAVEAGDGFGAGQYRLFPASADGTVAFSGISAPPGFSGSFDPQSGVLTIETAPVAGYASWSTTAFPAGAPNTGPQDDYSGDGVLNIWLYALGLDPTVPGTFHASPAAPSIERRGEDLVFRFAPATDRPDLSLVVEFSTDLLNWVPRTAGATTLMVGTQPEYGVVLNPGETGFHRLAIEPARPD